MRRALRRLLAWLIGHRPDEVGVLRLDPGDIVVLNLPDGLALSRESLTRLAESLGEALKAAGHDNPVLILPPGVSLTTIKRRAA